MKTDLNIEGFMNYAEATGKYNDDQLDAIEESLYALEDELAQLSWKVYGIYSSDYIAKNLSQCCKKLVGFMMTCGMKQTKATAAADDFKKWIKLFD